MKEKYLWVVQTLCKGEWVDVLEYSESNQAIATRDYGNAKFSNKYRVMWRKVTTEDITEIK